MSTSIQIQLYERTKDEEYQQVVFCEDRKVGLKAIIAIHNTNLGPGTGGCRMYPYKDTTAAVEDVLRLSKGMSYKAAISGLKLGGAKAVIIGNPKTDKSPALLKRFGQFVENLHGQYITAKDVGITGEDLMMVRENTRHILGIEGLAGSSGDPSPMTAFGVFNGMKAAAKHAFGDASLKGKRIAVQGLGYVSYSLVKQLVAEGASVVGADLDSATVAKFQREFGIDIVSPEVILAEQCDILSPNALGAVVNMQTIPQIKAKVIAGAANNQLATDEDGFELMRRGIVYAPDYAINAGGLINIYHERGGYDAARALDHTGGIYRTIEEVLARADKEKVPPHRIADRIAEERLAAGPGAIKG